MKPPERAQCAFSGVNCVLDALSLAFMSLSVAAFWRLPAVAELVTFSGAGSSRPALGPSIRGRPLRWTFRDPLNDARHNRTARTRWLDSHPMRLLAFEVARFRNIVESGTVDVQADVTCLVGKNEAGKTAALQALYRLNPAKQAVFSVQDDYPRWLLVPDRREGRVAKTSPVRAWFELTPEDVAAVEAVAGEGVITDAKLTVSRKYEDTTLWWSVNEDEGQAVSNLLATSDLNDAAREIVNQPTFRGLLQSIEKARQAEHPAEVQAQLDAVEASARALLGDEGTRLFDIVHRILRPRLPRLFYFSNYSILPGRVDLDELSGEEEPGDSGLQTARALLALADTDPNLLGNDDYEARKAELEAVSNELTSQVFEYWKQNTELQVQIDVDKQTVSDANGQNAVARYLDVRVHDRRHGYTGNFGQRSSGFQWFFSFLAAFSEFEHYESPVIVLLDEPGLGLHGRAQADFLRFINERLGDRRQVIYTTHSPFMIETGKMERVRIVEDRGPAEGSRVSSDVFTTDRDSLFPLQAALGYDIAQSLFIGDDNLLLEGTSDFTYLTTMSDYLQSKGRAALDERWTLVPAGSGSNIATFVALLGGHLDVSVLIDSDTKGSQKLTELASRGLLDEQRLITVGSVLGLKNADIEDVFTPGDYLKLYNGAFGEQNKVGDLPQGDRIVKQLASLRGDDYNHGLPADYLLRNRADLLDGFAETTLDQFERLVETLNATLA